MHRGVKTGSVMHLHVPASAPHARVLPNVADSWFDRHVHRRLSRPLSALAIKMGLTPNMVSGLSLLFGLVGADGLGYGSAAAASLGFLFYFISVVLDHVDGEVARLTHAESRLGALLDVWVDAVVNAAVVFGMGINVRAHGFAPGALLGLIGATGVMASTFSVKHWPPGSARSAGRTVPLILDMLADRLGFHLTLGAYVLLLARAPERLPIVMVVVALGSHAYWVARAAASRSLA
jgi:phosphatidylglycerophosphate synthase